MRYFDNVIQETLRVYPPVPSTSRHAIKDDTLPNGMKLKAGTTLIYSALFLHTNPKYWDNPSKFDPDRWNGLELKHPCQFTPFHAGPMQCLGRHMALIEAKILLIILFRKFKFTLAPNQSISAAHGITLGAVPGLVVTVDLA